jgi:hypothetical protein
MKLLKRDSLSSRVDEMERVIHFLRSGSDIEASTILARLRLGQRIEDIAKGFPTVSLPPSAGAPPSLLVSESSNASANSMNPDSPTIHSATAGPSVSKPDSTVSHVSPTLERSIWPGPDVVATSQMSPGKGKQPAVVGEIDKNAFMLPLFDRDDYMLARNESDQEEDIYDGDVSQLVDPRLIQRSRSGSDGSLMDNSRIRVSSPENKLPTKNLGEFRSIHATHHQRQSISNTIRIHHTFDVRDLLDNVALSSSSQAKSDSADLRDVQANNLSLPTWAMMIATPRPGSGSLRYAFSGILEKATAMIELGTPVELIIETHPNIAALFDKDQYENSGITQSNNTALKTS